MYTRQAHAELLDELSASPAVALLGPRQVGKTTLALAVARGRPHLYLDLESERDRSKMREPELFLEAQLDKLVILDEVHRAPELFPVLRGLIDRARRLGHETGRYLLLGSASLDLLKQSGETLAGRIAFIELAGLNVLETGTDKQDALWLRGGFPESLRAASDLRSLRWRENFIRTYLERDIPQLGPRIAAETLRRFWTMLAHHQGGLLNATQLGRNLGLDVKTVQSFIGLLCDLLLVRRLPPWHANIGKRLVKAPKVFVRDNGLLHALLGIESRDQVLSHMVAGASWESFCMESLLSCAPPGATAYFYRTGAGAEIDLVLAWPGEELWAVEFKLSLSPKLERGFHHACEDLKPSRKWVVYPGQETYPIAQDIQAVPLHAMCEAIRHGHSRTGSAGQNG